MNLVEGLQRANNESREFLAQLDETEKLLGKPHGSDPGLNISRQVTLSLIRATEEAIASGDVLQMLAAANLHGLGEEAECEE